jgi:hypothetical protein
VRRFSLIKIANSPHLFLMEVEVNVEFCPLPTRCIVARRVEVGEEEEEEEEERGQGRRRGVFVCRKCGCRRRVFRTRREEEEGGRWRRMAKTHPAKNATTCWRGGEVAR